VTSLRGFLELTPNGHKRMTATQQATVVNALIAVRDYVIDEGITATERLGLAYAEAVISQAFNRYPLDRSCHTCDNFVGTTCSIADAEVPQAVREDGCASHATDGTPF